MALVETQPNEHGPVRHGTKKVASLAPHGGGRVVTPAVRGIPGALLRSLERSVWAPVLLKAFAVLAGMLALAAIGASSIARGSGVRATAPSAKPSPTLTRAAVTPFAEASDAGATPSDAGPPLSDAGSDAGAISVAFRASVKSAPEPSSISERSSAVASSGFPTCCA